MLSSECTMLYNDEVKNKTFPGYERLFDGRHSLVTCTYLRPGLA
jgi:hypothetical protein